MEGCLSDLCAHTAKYSGAFADELLQPHVLFAGLLRDEYLG